MLCDVQSVWREVWQANNQLCCIVLCAAPCCATGLTLLLALRYTTRQLEHGTCCRQAAPDM
jgi:hypothetical protein